MAYHFIDENILTDIADAIRSKTGSSASIEGEDMATEIENIPSGGGGGPYNTLCFTAEQANAAVYLQTSKTLNINLQYSYDNSTWNDWNFEESGNVLKSSRIVLQNIGDKVYIRGNNSRLAISNSVYSKFVMDGGKIAASGSIQSLLTYDCTYTLACSYCFAYLFKSCSALTTAPELPATTLETYCYYNMFQYCSSLTTAPELPSTSLSACCYYQMFYNCTSLTTAPELPATTLADSCYFGMFRGCTALTTAPELPAIQMFSSSYKQMFYGCTALTTAPELPAVTLSSYCYEAMFYGCTALTEAPKLLSAKVDVGNCYYQMFYNCTSLTTSPEIYCSPTTSNSFYQMFYGCTSLNKIIVHSTSWNTSYASNWVQNVAATGVFIKSNDISISSGTSGIPSGWTTYYFDVVFNYQTNYATISTTIPNATMYYTTDNTTPTTSSTQYTSAFNLDLGDYGKIIKVLIVAQDLQIVVTKLVDNYFYVEAINTSNVKYNSTSNAYQYSIDYCSTWNNYTNNTNISVSAGNRIYFKRINNNSYINTSGGTSYCFTFSDNVNVGGCISSLSHGETTNGLYECSSLYPNSGARYMFYNATKLKSAEKLIVNLKNTGEGIHQQMFSGCTGLTKAPKLPMTTVYSQCYYQMFKGCTGLTTTPSLPATTLQYKCYYGMFHNCSSLTATPSLPATNLAEQCYYDMFNGCTALTTTPELPAITLQIGCYFDMFYGCTSLTTVYNMPATTLAKQCCYQMFYQCSSLTSVPNLIATVAQDSCYRDMFYQCTSLETAPEIYCSPSTTTAFYEMFKGCSKLKYIKVHSTTWNTTYAQNWVNGVAATGTFVKPSGTSITTGNSGIPSGWTVTNY